jgi:hypothetical protein
VVGGALTFFVMPGLDPGTIRLSKLFHRFMDCRVKPGNDENDWQ